MKRCPQCEFIYEDEQINCDMDGTILAFDASVAAANAVNRSQLRTFALPAIVGTMLAALLFVAFYASPLMFASPDVRSRAPEVQTSPTSKPSPEPAATKPAKDQPSPSPSAEVASDERRAEAVAIPTNDREAAKTNHTNSRAADSRLTIRRGVPALPRVPSLRRLPPARVGAPASSPQTTRHREVQHAHGDSKRPSKVGSFLKKTGRIIKKPFKF
jgi:hypothetical protein